MITFRAAPIEPLNNDDIQTLFANIDLILANSEKILENEQYRNIWDTKDAWFCGNSAAGYGGVFNAESSPCAKWRDASNAGIFLSNFSE